MSSLFGLFDLIEILIFVSLSIYKYGSTVNVDAGLERLFAFGSLEPSRAKFDYSAAVQLVQLPTSTLSTNCSAGISLTTTVSMNSYIPVNNSVTNCNFFHILKNSQNTFLNNIIFVYVV